eukprot:scaffold20903_cov99-Isochrysis_galbana.AAC.9
MEPRTCISSRVASFTSASPQSRLECFDHRFVTSTALPSFKYDRSSFSRVICSCTCSSASSSTLPCRSSL